MEILTAPARAGAMIGYGVVTGDFSELEKQIQAAASLSLTYEQTKKYKTIILVLFQDEDISTMRKNFASRFWDATHEIDRARMGASIVSEALVTIILGLLSAGFGAAANIAAKTGKLVNTN